MMVEVLQNGRVIGPYLIDRLLETGDTCFIYLAIEPQIRKKYILKLEPIDAPHPTLQQEMECYNLLKGSKYFPAIVSNGQTQNWRYICMDLLGPTLEKFTTILPNKTFSKESSIKIARQMLCCIQELHEKNIIHGEVALKHFLIRPDSTYPISMIDLNHAWLTTSMPVPHRNKSKKTHPDRIFSRRNDLLDWFYLVLLLNDGKLPWTGIEDHKRAERMRTNIPVRQLCASLPEDFQDIYTYIVGLQHDEKPDYNRILQSINAAMMKARCDQSEYEWITMDQTDVSTVSLIDLIPQVTTRPCYMSKDPEPKVFYKPTVYDDTIVPPRKKQEPIVRKHPEDLKQLNVEAYRQVLPDDPFVHRKVGKLPDSPTKEEAPESPKK